MGLITLNEQAAAMLRYVQKQVGPVQAELEQAISQACQASPQQRLTADDLEKMLIQAMPEKKQAISDGKKACLGYQADGTNAKFLTQILATRIVKDEDAIYNPPQPTPPIRRDPMYMSFNIDPRADFVLLFNARDVDRSGQPLLMKVLVRDRADLTKLDLTKYRTIAPTPDIKKIADDADYVDVAELNEAEFNFGDPLKQVSVGPKGEELSTSVMIRPQNERAVHYYYGRWNGVAYEPDKNRPVYNAPQVTSGDQLDTQRVAAFDDRIKLKIETTPTLPAGAWLDTSVNPDALKVSLNVDRGYVFEPGAQANIYFWNSSVTTAVPNDDAHLLGSPSAATAVAVTGATTLRQILSTGLRTRTWTTNSDMNDNTVAAANLVYAQAKSLSVAGRDLQALSDVALTKAELAAAKIAVEKVPLPNDPELDGQRVRLTLDKGFVAGKDGVSVKGWKVVAGFVDEKGIWQEASPVVVQDDAGSRAAKLSFDLTDADEIHRKNCKLELRVFNENGIPATRVLVPFREIGWAVDARQGTSGQQTPAQG